MNVKDLIEKVLDGEDAETLVKEASDPSKSYHLGSTFKDPETGEEFKIVTSSGKWYVKALGGDQKGELIGPFKGAGDITHQFNLK